MRVFNYNTTEKIKTFEAHQDYIRSMAVHPTLPYLLTASDDMTIKLWDWDRGMKGHPRLLHSFCQTLLFFVVKLVLSYVLCWHPGWECIQTFEGHSHYVMQVEFNPKDSNTFASASLDRSIKVH